MSCITWQTETYLILKQYQSGEILHAFLPALNDCTEKKKEQNNIPAKRKITSNFPLCCYSNLKTRKCKIIYLLLIK